MDNSKHHAAAAEQHDNLASLFFQRAHERDEHPFLWFKENGRYWPISWAETNRRIQALARSLKALGVEKGDRVALVSENRPEWLIADLAIMALGAVTVPGFTTNTTADHQYLLEHSGAKGVILSTKALAQNVLPAAMESASCQWAVTMEVMEQGQASTVSLHSWDHLIAEGDHLPDDVEAIADGLTRTDLACIIYTSGTGGTPKGVMLSHGAILCNCEGAHDLLLHYDLGEEVFLSFLPLCHSYEHTAGQFLPILLAAQIYYAEGIDHLLRNLSEAQPTIMTAVPRLYESMHKRITNGLKKESNLKRWMFDLTVRLGNKRLQNPGHLTLAEQMMDRLVERLVRDKIRARFGGRLKAMVSGGAALNPDIGRFFLALGLPVLQGYGQTETAPVVSVNLPQRIKIDTVGPPMKGVEVRIAEDGEILVAGELLMDGYWRDEAATSEVLQNGWLHTGDIGTLDGDGYLTITDRKKDIIVLSGGDNVSPARVEGILCLEDAIHQVMVYGDRQPHLVAVIVPDETFLDQWGEANDTVGMLADVHNDPSLKISYAKILDRVNKRLAPKERVRRFIIARESFSLDNGQMTPTLKIRRHEVLKAYKEELNKLYRGE